MANVLRLQNSSGTVLEFHDRTKVLGWKFLGPPSVNREKNISGRGCGFTAAGASAVLDNYHFLNWTRNYELRLTGADWGAAEALAYTLKDHLDNAVKYQTGETGGVKLWLVRHLADYGQARARVWTVLAGMWVPIEEEEYALNPTGARARPHFPIRLELDLMDGTTSVDGQGYPST